MEPWIPFFSTLIWQLLVLLGLFLFRGALVELLSKLATFRHGDTELTFQEHATSAEEPKKDIHTEIAPKSPEGFLTRPQINALVNDFGRVADDETVTSALLLFQTGRQQTWLARTNKQVFCILDDEGTRSSGRLLTVSGV